VGASLGGGGGLAGRSDVVPMSGRVPISAPDMGRVCGATVSPVVLAGYGEPGWMAFFHLYTDQATSPGVWGGYGGLGCRFSNHLCAYLYYLVRASPTLTPKTDRLRTRTMIRELAIQPCSHTFQNVFEQTRRITSELDDFHLSRSKFITFLTYFIKKSDHT
jgi:hypothetical protein